jgi:predicted O-methyltransferase YrrM
LWLALACRERGDRLTTFDLDDDKVRLARQSFAAAGVEPIVNLVHADALQRLSEFSQIAFCFLDAEKNLYPSCYELVVPRLVPGGLFVADNLLSHEDELRLFATAVSADPRVDALVAPIGKGILICRRTR